MSTASSRRLRQFYARFGEHRFADLTELLADDVWYMQINSMNINNCPRGPLAVGGAYADWGRWFANFRIGEIALTTESEEEVRKVAGATNCFTARYQLVGRYTTPIPGLRILLPPIGREVDLIVTDKVYMNGQNRLNRIVNSIQERVPGSNR